MLVVFELFFNVNLFKIAEFAGYNLSKSTIQTTIVDDY